MSKTALWSSVQPPYSSWLILTEMHIFIFTVQILDAGNPDNPFQLFLVSVQHGNSLIGEMRGGPESNDSVLTCGTTSIKNADTSNKTEVEFYWTAPSDLDSDQVIVRFVMCECGIHTNMKYNYTVHHINKQKNDHLQYIQL